MIPAAFEYHRPKSVDEAVGLLSRYGDEGRVIAGGHSLVPMMKLRLAEPAHLIDLRDLNALKGIQANGAAIEIGAMTTQHELLASGLLAEACPIVPEAVLLVADPQVRYCGTLGGNLANGDPGNDLPAVMQCLDAKYVLRGPKGEREVAAREFYEAAYFTARAEDELLTAVSIPIPPAGHGYAYEKLKRKVGDYATAAAAVLLTMKGETCESASVALTNVAQTPLYVAAAAQVLAGSRLDDGAISAAVEAAKEIAEPVADMRGPEDYRTHAAGVMVRRAIERALARAQG